MADIENLWEAHRSNRLVYETVESILQQSLKRFPSPSKKVFTSDEVGIVADLFFYKKRITSCGSNEPKKQFFKKAEIHDPDFGRAFCWANLFNEARPAMIDALRRIEDFHRRIMKSPRLFVKFWYFHHFAMSGSRQLIERDARKGVKLSDYLPNKLNPERDFVEFFWSENADRVAAWFNKAGISITTKTVEKIRAELREYHSPQKTFQNRGLRVL